MTTSQEAAPIPPTSPAEMLLEEFMPEYELKAPTLAKHLGIHRASLQTLLDGGRCSPAMAVRLAALFGTSAEMWMNLQTARDLWDARNSVDISTVKPLTTA